MGFDDAYVVLFTSADRVALRILGDPAAAEDVAAETMARALVAWGRIHGYADRWVLRVATNLAIDAIRRRRHLATAQVVVPAEDAVLRRIDLLVALRRLPRRQAQVVVLRYLVGLGDGEIAQTLGVSNETVKTHLERGLEALRRRIPLEEAEHEEREVEVDAAGAV